MMWTSISLCFIEIIGKEGNMYLKLSWRNGRREVSYYCQINYMVSLMVKIFVNPIWWSRFSLYLLSAVLNDALSKPVQKAISRIFSRNLI